MLMRVRPFHNFTRWFQREYLVILIALLPGCRCDIDNMARHPAVRPSEPSTFFADQRSQRPTIAGTVPWGRNSLQQDVSFIQADELLYTGKVNGKVVDLFPFPMTRAMMERGRQNYNIFCAVCHGGTGDGDGMIVRRGFPRPPSYHDPRLLASPAGHLFDVITNGFGTMYSYRDRISVEDRWAVVAYIRALQLSQHATLDDVPRGQAIAPPEAKP